MAMNDPLAAALSKIENAEKVGKSTVVISPVSNVMKKVFTILNDNHYIGGYDEEQTAQGSKVTINLTHNVNKVGAIKPRFAFKANEFERVEKHYLPAKDFGVIIVTTSQGIMTLEEAKKLKIGGKLVAYCY